MTASTAASGRDSCRAGVPFPPELAGGQSMWHGVLAAAICIELARSLCSCAVPAQPQTPSGSMVPGQILQAILTGQRCAPDDPNMRMESLIYEGGSCGQINREKWNRPGVVIDQPSHMTFDRVHGGIGP